MRLAGNLRSGDRVSRGVALDVGVTLGKLRRRGVGKLTGVEIDMVVTDSLKALELYESIFSIERVEVTDFPRGENEVVFTLYGVRFHLLDENPQFFLQAPRPGDPKPIWFNIVVPDINATFAQAINAGCIEVQPVTACHDYGVSNAMFRDVFGHLWMLHQIHREVSLEERQRLWEARKAK